MSLTCSKDSVFAPEPAEISFQPSHFTQSLSCLAGEAIGLAGTSRFKRMHMLMMHLTLLYVYDMATETAFVPSDGAYS